MTLLFQKNNLTDSVIKKNKKDRFIQTYNMVNKKKVSQTSAIKRTVGIIILNKDLFEFKS